MSIRSLKPTIPKHQERLSWTLTQTIKPGNFITPSPFYSVKQNPIQMTVLDLGFLHIVLNAMAIHQTRTVGLDILEDNGSGWVSSHAGKGFLHALDYFGTWTLHILGNYGWMLKSTGIYDAM